MSRQQPLSDILSPVSPLSSSTLSRPLPRFGFFLSATDAQGRLSETGEPIVNNNSQPPRRPISASQAELHLEIPSPLQHNIRPLNIQSFTDRAWRSDSSLVRDNVADPNGTFLQPTIIQQAESTPRSSYTSFRLERPFTPNIPENVEHESETQLHSQPLAAPAPVQPIVQAITAPNTLATPSPKEPTSQADYKYKYAVLPGTKAADRPYWLNILLCAIRLYILGTSLAICGVLAYTLGVFTGPGSTSLLEKTAVTQVEGVTTGLLVAISFISFFFSAAILTLSLRVFFAKRWVVKDGWIVVSSAFFVILWVVGLVVYKLLGKDDSLRSVACGNQGLDESFAVVCQEQDAGFYMGIAVACLEQLTFCVLAAWTCMSRRRAAQDADLELVALKGASA